MRFVWESEHSDFYRKFWESRAYTPKFPLTEEGWSTVPHLERSDIAAREHPSERLFVDLKDVECLRSTSGTSKRNALYLWRAPFSESIYDWYIRLGSRRILGMYPLTNYANLAAPAPRKGLEILFGDSRNLSHSAAVARIASVDTLVVTPTLGTVVQEYLQRESHHTQIKLIVLYAEYCSTATYRSLRKGFPHARFLFTYASSESSGFVAVSTDRCEEPNRKMHMLPEFYVEAPNNELIITSLISPHPFPLIRYKTGDAGSIEHAPCACGNPSARMVVEGRIGGDYITMGGGQISAEEIDNVLETFYPYIEQIFKVEVSERVRGERPCVHLTFSVTKRPNVSLDTLLLGKQIELALLKQLRLTPTMRLGQAVTAGLFETPEIRFVQSMAADMKNPRLLTRSTS